MAETVSIATDRFEAEIALAGAELIGLRDLQHGGQELMHSGDPAWWGGRAPLLFPNVGALNDDVYRLDGREFAMPKHGFARRSRFELIESSVDAARFRLTDSAETRAIYPFAFALDMAFVGDGATLTMAATVHNRGEVDMPASFGFHPAFRWPLPGASGRAGHRLIFERPEPAPLCRLTPGGLMTADARPSPVAGDTLELNDDLFTADALIWDHPASRRLRYEGGGPVALDIGFPDAEWLGIWTRPGAPFVCVEPWWGHADPAGYEGDIRDKPGIIRFAPGESRAFAMQVTLTR
ncbi:aldose 1-epimerase family protein [Sphingomonas sp. DT-204]|uniref:aldose 1-epimerase family protein n=1 Tax=Sphingomonas sp. DT-204 TaxID=3396166 RepID=UPI003F1C6636